MATLDEFKANLIGGGARANQFRVTFNTPGAIATGLDVRKASFLIKAAALPGQTIGEIAIPFRGRNLYIAGDREFETWDTTVINDTDFMVRNGIERWLNAINDLAANTGLTNVADYTADLVVEQLDRDDTVLKSYILRSCFPQATAAIDLSYETVNAIEEFTVTWRYTHFEASAVNF
tara:strand:+ start:1025 stop:1555 length:531 start_codon:yes stop_codon:yes gene_type:complete